MRYDTKTLVRAGIIAAIYSVLTVFLGDTQFGPIQFRVAEAMTILPFFDIAAVPGLFIGCLIANITGGLGPIDIVFGSLTTLIAAYLTSKMPNKYLATLPPILLNAFIIPIWLSKAFNMPYIVVVGTIGFSQFIAAGILGIIFANIINRVYRKY